MTDISEAPVLQHLTMRHVVDIPARAGRCTGITTFRGRVLIATEYGGVFEVVEDFFTDSYRLFPIGLQVKEPEG